MWWETRTENGEKGEERSKELEDGNQRKEEVNDLGRRRRGKRNRVEILGMTIRGNNRRIKEERGSCSEKGKVESENGKRK